MAQKHEYLVILPDRAGALPDRMKVRPDHLKALTPDVQSGFWVFGGAMLDEPHVESSGQGPKIKGSIMLAVAESEEEVWEKLKGDVYATSGVWEMDKVQVIPFKSAVRKPL